jgi:hypothetical protein
MKSMPLTGLAALIGALVVSAPLTLAAQSAPAPATPVVPAGYDIPKDMTIIAAPNADDAKRIAHGDPAIAAGHMAVELRAVMVPSLASLVVKY